MTPKLILATLLALMASTALAHAQESLGTVKRSTGNVVIDRAGVQLQPKAGTEIRRGDRVITGSDGHVNIKLNTAGSLSVGPDTAVAPEQYVPARETVAKPAPALLQGLASFLSINKKR